MTVIRSIAPGTVRKNLVLQPQPGGTGWSMSAGLTRTVENSGGPTSELTEWTKATLTAASTAQKSMGPGASSNRASVTPGVEYTGSVYGITGTTARQVFAEMVFYSASGTELSSEISTPVTADADEWDRYAVTAVAPALAVTARVAFGLSAGTSIATGTYFGMVGSLLEVGDTLLDYFDGDTLIPGSVTQWVAAVNLSESVAYSTVVIPDLVLNYESDQDSGTVVHDILGSTQPAVTIRPDRSRSGSLRLFYRTEADAETARSTLATGGPFELVTDWAFELDARIELGYPTLDGIGVDPPIDMTFVRERSLRKSLDVENKVWTIEVGYREIAA